MGLVDAFNSVWKRAYETYGQGTPQSGEHFNKSAQFQQMQNSVTSAAPDERWQGAASEAYAQANKGHAEVFGKLVDLDKRYGAEVDRSAAVVAAGRQSLETTRSNFMAAAAGLNENKAADRTTLMRLVSGGMGEIQNTLLKTTEEQAAGGQRMNGITTEYAALGNQLFKEGGGQGEKDGKDGKGAKSDDKDKDKDKDGLLDYRDGQNDGEALRDGKLTPEQLQHLHDASTLTKQQLDDLAAGKSVDIGPERMAYLNQLMRPFDGMTPAQIKEAQAKLPADQRTELAQAFAIVSNPNIKSGMPSTGGALSDTDVNSYVPAAGSLSNLPHGLASELGRPDRVTLHPFTGAPSPYGVPMMQPNSTELKGIGALQDASDIFKPAGAGYTNGSEATRAMLQASSQYALADSAHRGEPGSIISSDQHGGGSDPRAALADIVQSASTDHVSIHDLATKSTSDQFLQGLTKENWGGQSAKIGSAFQWMGDNPHDPISSGTANSVAHFLSDHKNELQHMPGGGSFGSDNQELSQAMARGVGPYLGSLAGADPSVMDSPGIKHFTNPTQMSDLFSVLDTDHKSGEIINNAALQQQNYLETHAAEFGLRSNEVQIAERLHHAMIAGAEDAQNFDQAEKQFTAAENDAAKSAMWDTGVGALGAVTGIVPGGEIPAAIANILNPELKQNFLHTTDPTTIVGTDYLTRFFTTHDSSVTQQVNILNGIIAANPALAHDPTLSPYVNGAQIDPHKYHGNAYNDLNTWLAIHGTEYNYNDGAWAHQMNLGDTRTGWVDPTETESSDEPH